MSVHGRSQRSEVCSTIRMKMSLVLLSMLMLSKNSAVPVTTVPHRTEGRTIYQVDSNVLSGPTRASYSAVPVVSRLWPGARVPYQINPNLETLLPNVQRAMQKIQNRTCVRFVEKTNADSDYINIAFKEGCWSYVGRATGVQELSLGQPCGESMGVVLHELLHSLGMWHEHDRSDRDEYVDVLWDNIQEDEKSNFQKLLPWENNILGEPFDFNSVMMYGSYSFSKDEVSPTLVSRVNGRQLVDLSDKNDLSEGDVRRINKLYECQGETRPTPEDVPVLDCPFHNDICGFTSQTGPSLTKWKLEPDVGMSLSASEGETTGYVFSPYLKPYLRDRGCLSFSLLLQGPALKGVRVYRQTELEQKIVLAEYSNDVFEADNWIDEIVDVSFQEDFRLVFHGVIVSGSTSDVITLADLKFEWKPCS